MNRIALCWALGAFVTTVTSSLWAAEELDVVSLKDGSVIYGEVIEMSRGELQIRTAFGVDGLVKVKWTEVTNLTVNRPLPFHLKEGTVIVGRAKAEEGGTLLLQAEPMAGMMTVPMSSITSINPPALPPVVYIGSLTAGFSQSTGNSHLRNASLLGDFTGRSESLRLTINGRYIYGDDKGSLIVRNSRGTIKLDFFMTKRFYWFASSYFEQDTFQDLKMRTSLASGPGYQIIERGDFTSPLLKDMTFYAEAGLAYFNEDFKLAPDRTSTRARWSIKLNWPLYDDQMTIYHYQEGYPSLQNTRDVFVTADTGVRFKIIGGVVSGLQWTIRYNSRPAANTTDTDNLYLLTFGYSFDTNPKR